MFSPAMHVGSKAKILKIIHPLFWGWKSKMWTAGARLTTVVPSNAPVQQGLCSIVNRYQVGQGRRRNGCGCQTFDNMFRCVPGGRDDQETPTLDSRLCFYQGSSAGYTGATRGRPKKRGGSGRGGLQERWGWWPPLDASQHGCSRCLPPQLIVLLITFLGLCRKLMYQYPHFNTTTSVPNQRSKNNQKTVVAVPQSRKVPHGL